MSLLANLLHKLHKGLNSDEVENLETCAKCGSEIHSLKDAATARINENTFFFCSSNCRMHFRLTLHEIDRLTQYVAHAANSMESASLKETELAAVP